MSSQAPKNLDDVNEMIKSLSEYMSKTFNDTEINDLLKKAYQKALNSKTKK